MRALLVAECTVAARSSFQVVGDLGGERRFAVVARFARFTALRWSRTLSAVNWCLRPCFAVSPDHVYVSYSTSDDDDSIAPTLQPLLSCAI